MIDGNNIVPPDDDPRWVTLYEHHPSKSVADQKASILAKRVICRDVKAFKGYHTSTNPWTLSYKTIMDREIESKPILLRKPERFPSTGRPPKDSVSASSPPVLKRRRHQLVSNQLTKGAKQTNQTTERQHD